MKPFRFGLAWLLVFGMSTGAFAGDLQESIARAIREQQSNPSPKMDKAFMWPGAALFAGGMTMALYGFLHTSGGEFVSGEVSKESNTKLGAAGLAVAGAGGAILFLGAQRAKSAPAITIGPGSMRITKKLSW
jgi:hypothetical protein